MDCPFCGNKMIRGYIYSASKRGSVWLPETEPCKWPWDISQPEKKDGFRFMSRKNRKKGTPFPYKQMMVCSKCKKGIVDTILIF
ncbi:MAG: hypothetical protein IKW01_05590 [Firmicutes bacterium]|nr:hypothetical protein [Bacillota bacterium]